MKTGLFLIVIIAGLSQANQHSYDQFLTVNGNYIQVSSDATGFITAADLKGTIYNWNNKGTLLQSQAYAQYGRVSCIDASNPLEIFIYFITSRKLIVLDNQLNLKKELDFNMNQNYQVQGIGRAADGMCWVLDARERVLRKIDFTGTAIQTQMISSHLFPKKFSKILDIGNAIVISADEDSTVQIFNTALLPLRTIKKPTKPCAYYNEQLYVPHDSVSMLSISIKTGLSDTFTVNGKPRLGQIAVYSGGMVNRTQSALSFYTRNP
jgi:hypothetical protein